MLHRFVCLRPSCLRPASARRGCFTRGACVVTTARLRPGRTVLQKTFRQETLSSNQDALTYLHSVGVDRVACMIAFSKASEALFYAAGDGDVPELTKERIEGVVAWLRRVGVEPAGVAALLTSHSQLLSYDLTRLEALSAFLGTLGVTGERFAAVIEFRPSLLGLTVDKNLAVMVDYLRSVETPEEKILEYVERSL